MNEILIATAIIGGIGLVGGILLAVISHFCDSGETNERLAEIRGTDAQTLINKAFENGCRIYGINAEELK